MVEKELNDKQLRLLDAAEELFSQNGFVGTSVRDIAAKANVNIAMISYYFGSKDQLLQRLLIYRTANSRVLLKSIKEDRQLDSWSKIEKIIDFYVDKLLKNRNFHTIISRQISMTQDKETLQLLIEIKTESRQLIQGILKEGIENGTFREVNVPLTIASVLGTISHVSMSQPVYENVLQMKNSTEKAYIKVMKPLLKEHLTSMLHHHLAKQDKYEK